MTTVRKESIGSLKAELTKALQRAETAEAKAAAANNPGALALGQILETADAAYFSVNRKFLEQQEEDRMMAPSGESEEARDHVNFKAAFERVLDGFDRSINGFKSSKGRSFFGVRQNEEFWRGKLAELRANGDALITDRGVPTEDARYPYERWLESSELLVELEAIRAVFVQAYDMVSVSEEYQPFEKRMEALREKQQKAAAAAEKSAADVADLLKAAPSLAAMVRR